MPCRDAFAEPGRAADGRWHVQAPIAFQVNGQTLHGMPHTPDDAAQAASGREAPMEKHIVKDADHTYSTPSWERQVIRLTTEWFGKTLQP